MAQREKYGFTLPMTFQRSRGGRRMVFPSPAARDVSGASSVTRTHC